jgi:penicillin-binding protein 1B
MESPTPAVPASPASLRARLRTRRAVAVLVAGAAAAAAMVFMLGFAARVDALRDRRATGPSWSFPSRVFSDAVVLDPRVAVPPGHLLRELAAREYVETRGVTSRPGTFARTGAGWEIALRGIQDVPDPAGGGGPERVRVTYADSALARVDRLGGFPDAPPPDLDRPPRLEPVLVSYLLDEDRVRRTYVALDRVPEPVQEAILASEDRRFYKHLGLDLRANARALAANMKSREVVQGGSTITQQLARGLFLGSQRTLARKLAEIPLAIGLEVVLSKQEILEMYLNMVYWGEAEGGSVGGIAEAARWYFDAPVESLGTAEGALLAAMIPAPNAIKPFEDPRLATEKRNRVIESLADLGRIPRGEAERLKAMPLGVRRGPAPLERFPSFSGYLRQYLGRRVHKRAAETRGYTIFSTMDLGWQVAAEWGIDVGLARVESRMGRRRPPLEGAFVALEPGTGFVRALVGGRSMEKGDFNRATQARRQTGSAIKPIVYTAALVDPIGGFTPASTVPDERRVFGKGRWAWQPENEGGYHESVTLACALARSLNVATANLVEQIGPGTVARVAERFGLGRLKPVASIGLGPNEVTLLQLTSAFAVFAQAGMRVEPSPIRALVDGRGARLLDRSGTAEEVIPEGIAALMTGMLEDVVIYGVASPLRAYPGMNRPVAGKTGTTNDYRDGWFIGFTPDIVAGVWVGFDRPRSLGRAAAATALPIWGWTVGRMIGDFPRRPFASDAMLEYRLVDPWTGYLAEEGGCPAMRMPFLPGSAPAILCGWEADTLGTAYDDSLGSAAVWDTTYSDRDGRPLVGPQDTTVFEGPGAPEPESEPDTTEAEPQ